MAPNLHRLSTLSQSLSDFRELQSFVRSKDLASPETTGPQQAQPVESASYWEWTTEPTVASATDLFSAARIESNLINASRVGASEEPSKCNTSSDEYWAETSDQVCTDASSPTTPQHKLVKTDDSYWTCSHQKTTADQYWSWEASNVDVANSVPSSVPKAKTSDDSKSYWQWSHTRTDSNSYWKNATDVKAADTKPCYWEWSYETGDSEEYWKWNTPMVATFTT
jgi:hypothetical protein